ncbi:mono-functional DNA-alkylating methyl methanesulfonate N-term-domain-containing protein [Blyttiomyces helicus]|uniref:DNA damage-binding protein 1 n=1 Tax=Blyttiomyces helicus TaxID=388810 RepID=A0A4V1ISM1_9FUNG|nr:mono-functional DNA-alkylating methyl methanesulfonate N-term-domain-containing protein [Blyttiomyces helicus]|eukprot:RKO94037.1 mono-functional DNA-alkylating methyl methanesulfonate N-term-domain-containing protein [Blyttiomyces helicus]
MFYIVSARKPDSVTLTAKGNFTGPDDLNLIVAKGTHFEIHILVEDDGDSQYTLRLMMDVPVYGRIASMILYRPPGRHTDLLFVSTERYKFFVLSFNPDTEKLVTQATGDLRDRTGRAAEIGQIAIPDPEARVIGMHMYQGLFKVISLRKPELSVIAMCFLHVSNKSNHPVLAVLHQDSKEARHLKTYIIDEHKKEFIDHDLAVTDVEPAANILIPVPRSIGGGVIIVGEQTISYIFDKGASLTIPITPTIMKCYNPIGTDGSRYFLGDYLGKFYVLLLMTNEREAVVKDMRLELIGEVSQPSCIEYLDQGYVFIGSHFGDSQLIRINSGTERPHHNLELKMEFPNLAPTVDFCVVDVEKQGQGQIVACCGGNKDGSLRIIRNGIGIQEIGELEDMQELKGIWALQPNFEAGYDDTLVLSFIGETKLQAMDEEGTMCPVEEGSGFRTDEATLYCANMIEDFFIQVTPSVATLIACDSRAVAAEWAVPAGSRINHACGNASQVLLAISDGLLVYFEVRGGGLVEVSRRRMEHEVSAINATSIDPANPRSAAYCLVGLWNDMSVRLLSLPELVELDKQLLASETIPRSVLLAHIDGVDYAMAALGDGQLFNFVLDSASRTLVDRKKITLGTQPITLCAFQSDGKTNIFAASDRPTVIYSSNGKLLYSNVNLKEVTYMCPFAYSGAPNALALATEGVLKIGLVEAIQKLHIKKVPLGEMARRIVHQESSNTFGILTTCHVMDSAGEEEEKYFFKILDEQTYEILDDYKMDPFESTCSLLSMQFGDKDPKFYYIVGTAFEFPHEDEPQRGRILVFEVTDDRKIHLVHEQQTCGAVYALSALGERLVAGINSKVQLYRWEYTDTQTLSLVEKCGHHGHIIAVTIAVYGDFILVGDLLKSVTLLLYRPAEELIEQIARDPDTNWMTAIEAIDEDTVMCAEQSYNLFSLRKQSDSEVEEDRRRLVPDGYFHLGEPE